MIKKTSHLEHKIIDFLATIYGIKVDKITYPCAGADVHAFTCKADAFNGVAYFVKLKHNFKDDIGARVMSLVHDAGLKQVIQPIKTLAGHVSAQAENFLVTVFPFVEGQNGFDCELSEEQWISLGKALRTLHTIHVPPILQAKIRREAFSPKWQQVISQLLQFAPEKGDEVADNLIHFMKQHQATIERLLRQAEQLRGLMTAQKAEFVLCHSDIHAGNVLLQDSPTFYIVDWDEPIMAPKERDLMFIGAGVANVWNKPQQEQLFYQGYGKTTINQTILAYYRHERILEDIAILGEQLLLNIEGTSAERAQSYKHFTDQFEPNGVVDRAFAALAAVLM